MSLRDPHGRQEQACAVAARIAFDMVRVVGVSGAVSALLTALGALAALPTVDRDAVAEGLREMADRLPRIVEETRAMNGGGGRA